MSVILHVGAGPIRYPVRDGDHWLNVDREPSHNPDMVVDCTTMADRLTPNYFDALFSCHCIEHLPYPAGVAAFFDQARRVLKPGGTIRIVVPDLMKVARKYVAGESLRNVYDGAFHYGRDCPAERFVFFCRAWEHTIVFDEPLLTAIMREAGFENVRRMPFGVSDVPALCGVDRFESESMSIEAVRP